VSELRWRGKASAVWFLIRSRENYQEVVVAAFEVSVRIRTDRQAGEPAMSSIPGVAMSSIPGPAMDSVPGPAMSSIPGPAMSSIPGPVAADQPVLARTR
jgi:hypothetical protein